MITAVIGLGIVVLGLLMGYPHKGAKPEKDNIPVEMQGQVQRLETFKQDKNGK